ncbi:MAG: hypothetical protein V4772_08655 [Pseudomonadota bacterium]
MSQIKMAPVQYDNIELRGGLDLITPTLSMKSGACRTSLNFECLDFGGYGRIDGYERFSGEHAPSDAAYAVLYISEFVNTPALGDTITNEAAIPTGVVIAIGLNYVVYTKESGAFSVDDVLFVGATEIGTVIEPTDVVSAALNAEYTGLAADNYRADISAPVGDGPIRGGFLYNDLVYCVKDNVGATASNLWKQSGAGWVQINLLNEVTFTVGAVAIPADGATLTQGGVTAVVSRVIKQSGAWTGDAAGRFIIANPTGGNFAAGAATLTGGATVILSGIQTAITLLPGGRGEYVQANFFGQQESDRIYYCDGVNRIFEFDGTTVAPLSTGTVPDQPKYIAALKNHLWFAVGSSIISSGIGDPYNYTAIGGASEIACGDTVTGFVLQPGSQATGAMAVFCRNLTSVLYGTSAADWNLVTYNTGTGALDHTGQNLSQTYVMDDRGVYSLSASLNFGNLDQASLTNLIRTFIADRRTKVKASSIARDKSQYRIFFNDGFGLYLTIVNNEFIGVMPVYYPTYVNCTWEGTLSTGELVKFFGGADGHVYQTDVGTSFDGEDIGAYFQLNWASARNSRILKRYRRASIEMSGSAYCSINFAYSLGYGAADPMQPYPVNYDSPFTPTYWDSFTWDSFTWDGRTLFPTECEMAGTAENVQLTISSSSKYFAAFNVNSIIVHYTQRRGVR